MNQPDAQGGQMLEGKKVVLAYSGGLDTTVCLKWLEQRGATT
jgi:argininosuccinate synthase